jgi:hypothetical protein
MLTHLYFRSNPACWTNGPSVIRLHVSAFRICHSLQLGMSFSVPEPDQHVPSPQIQMFGLLVPTNARCKWHRSHRSPIRLQFQLWSFESVTAVSFALIPLGNSVPAHRILSLRYYTADEYIPALSSTTSYQCQIDENDSIRTSCKCDIRPTRARKSLQCTPHHPFITARFFRGPF